MTKKIIYFLTLISFTITSPCMAANSSRQPVVITSEPPGAEIYIGNQYQGTTPRKLPLQGNCSYRIIVQKNGYGSQYVDLLSKRKSTRTIDRSLSNTKYLAYGSVSGFWLGLLFTAISMPSTGGDITLGLFLLTPLVMLVGSAAGTVFGLAKFSGDMLRGHEITRFPKNIHFTLEKEMTEINK